MNPTCKKSLQSLLPSQRALGPMTRALRSSPMSSPLYPTLGAGLRIVGSGTAKSSPPLVRTCRNIQTHSILPRTICNSDVAPHKAPWMPCLLCIRFPSHTSETDPPKQDSEIRTSRLPLVCPRAHSFRVQSHRTWGRWSRLDPFKAAWIHYGLLPRSQPEQDVAAQTHFQEKDLPCVRGYAISLAAPEFPKPSFSPVHTPNTLNRLPISPSASQRTLSASTLTPIHPNTHHLMRSQTRRSPRPILPNPNNQRIDYRTARRSQIAHLISSYRWPSKSCICSMTARNQATTSSPW